MHPPHSPLWICPCLPPLCDNVTVSVSYTQCSSFENTYGEWRKLFTWGMAQAFHVGNGASFSRGEWRKLFTWGMAQAFHTDAKEGWSLFVGKWFALQRFTRDGVVFRAWHPPSTRVLVILWLQAVKRFIIIVLFLTLVNKLMSD